MLSRNKKDFDYQLDLTPFISLLSVCICFLLLTVAWFQIGSLTIKQVMGGETQSQKEVKKKASLWIYLKDQKQIEVRLKRGEQPLAQKFIKSKDQKNTIFDLKAFQKYVRELKKGQKDLDSAFIFPQAHIVYEDIVKVMDAVRQTDIFNVGLSPI